MEFYIVCEQVYIWILVFFLFVLFIITVVQIMFCSIYLSDVQHALFRTTNKTVVWILKRLCFSLIACRWRCRPECQNSVILI